MNATGSRFIFWPAKQTFCVWSKNVLFGDRSSIIKCRKSKKHSCHLLAPLLTTTVWGWRGGKLGRPGFWKNSAGLRSNVEYQKLEPDSQSCSASFSCSLAEKKINPPNTCSAQWLCTGATDQHPGLWRCCWEGSLLTSCFLQNGIYWRVSGCRARQQLVQIKTFAQRKLINSHSVSGAAEKRHDEEVQTLGKYSQPINRKLKNKKS